MKLDHTPRIGEWVWLVAFWALVSLPCPVGAVEAASDPERISVTYCTDCVPFHFRDDQGQPAGMIVDLWRLWSEKTGIAIDFRPATWSESLERVRSRHSQVHAGLFFNQQRDRYLDYGAILAKTDTHVFLHQTLPLIERVEDLAGYRTGVLAGDYVESYLKERLPDDAVIAYPDYETILGDLRAGKLKAFAADTPTGIYHLKRLGLLEDFKISDNHRLYSNDWRLAAAEGSAELLQILDRGMALISAGERLAIAKRWIGKETSADQALITGQSKTLTFTDEEQAWIDTHPSISVGIDAKWPPIDFIDDEGHHRGITADYLALLNTLTDIEFRPDAGESWSDMLDKAKRREIDMVATLAHKPEREEHWTYVAPYFETTYVILTRSDTRGISTIKDLYGKTVAVERGYNLQGRIRQDHPAINLLVVDSTLEALQAVSREQADAYVGNQVVSLWLSQKNHLLNLKMAADSGYGLNRLHFAVRPDWPELVSIIAKSVAAISDEQHRKIEQRWISLPGSTPEGVQTDSGESRLEGEADQTLSPITLIVWFLVFVLVLLLLLGLLRTLDRRLDGRLLERGNLSRLIVVLVSAFLVVVVFVAWLALERMDRQLRHELGETLSTVNDSVRQSLEMWLASHFREIQHVANDRNLLPLVEQLLALPRDANAIVGSEALEKARDLYRYHMSQVDAKGFFLIGPDRISIGSMRDTNIGTRNLIAEQQPELMDRAFAGETVFIPPIHSDVPLENASGRRSEKAATMFFATPVRNPSGQVIAVLTLRFDPAGDFGRITRVARIGATGETYAFDRQARLLTASRFQDRTDTGLERFDGNIALLSLSIRDPGRNLRGTKEIPAEDERLQWPLTRMAQAALGGRSGLDTAGYRDYLGVPVLGAWTWSDTLGIGLATEIDLAEALAPYRSMRILVLGALLGITFIALALMAFSIWLGQRTRSRLQVLVDERTDELRKIVQAVEQSPLCVVITSADGVIEHVNPTFTKVTGYSAAEVIGQNPRILKSGDTPPEQYQELWQTILAGKVWHSEIRNRRKDGQLYWGSVSIAPVTNDAGAVTHFVAMTEDVTEAKNVALALQHAEYTRNLALDAAQVGLWSGEIATNTWTWDSRTNRMMGFPEEMAPDLDKWVSILHPEDRDFVLEEFQAAIRGEKVFDVEYRVVRPDGALRTVSARGMTSHDESGKPLRIDGIVYDVTALRSAQAAIQEAQERNQLILDSAGEGIFGLDLDGCVTFCNRAAADMLGYGTDELLGTSMHETVHYAHVDGSRYDDAACPMRAAFHAGEVRQIDDEVLWRKDETAFPVEYSATPIGHAGDRVGAVVVFRDITERKRMEDALAARSEQLQAFFDVLGVGAVLFSQDGRILQANKISEEILGVSADEHVQRGLSDQRWAVFRTDGTPMPIQEYPASRVLAGEKVVTAEELVVARPQGDKVTISISAAKIPIEVGGGVALVFDDVTERNRIQREISEAKEIAEEATRAKSDFLANMSHEIRTPMNAIIGLSHLALGTELSRKQRDYLEKISGSANSLLGIINDILDFSKIEAGKLDMEQVDFDLIEVLDNLANVVAVKSAEKGLELIVDLADDVPMGLKGDPLRLNQILINLANNAVKFTEQGEIAIRVEVQQRDAEEVRLRFAVRDTGIGMTEAQRSKLFQAFSQADSSISRKFGGTGLGLTICKRLVEMMDGEIGVDSQPGVGSEFHFTACFGIGAETHQTRPRALPGDLRDLRVLVVDDNPTSRTILARYLESFGFLSGEAANGAQALAKLEAADPPYRLVLMDWKMPGMDGIETTRRIRADDKLATMPQVLMVSAYGREELREAASDVGIEAYLVKPVNPSTLLDATLEALGHHVDVSLRRGPGARAADHVRGAHLLLVEDNEINQQVATELLEQAGLEVTIANHGREAVDMLSAHEDAFDGVLMDIQMPVMDGYTATREIRKDPRFSRLPIIAMTANAMAQDRQQALDSGMNDHVAKPIDVKELFAVLGRWIEVPEERRAGTRLVAHESGDDHLAAKAPAATEIPKLEGIDTEGGLKRMGGNRALYLKILRKFRDGQADVVNRIEVAANAGDTVTARREAHTLKGLAGNIGAQSLYETARRVERLFEKDTPDDVLATPLSELRTELDAVMVALRQLSAIDAVPASGATLDIARVGVLLARLRELLEEDDTDASDLMDELVPLMAGSTHAGPLARLADLVGEYAFEEALKVLDELQRAF